VERLDFLQIGRITGKDRDERHRAPFSANHFVATGFLVPAMVAVLFLTLVPMGMVLSRAFYDTQVRDAFPRTLEALSGWDGGGPLPERAHEALAQDLRTAYAAQTLAGAASKLNERRNGLRSVVMGTARRLTRDGGADTEATLRQSSPLWAEPDIWATIRAAGKPFSLSNLARVFAPSPASAEGTHTGGVYADMLVRTLAISFGVTLLTVLIGYPLAYALTFAPVGLKRPLFLLSFIPLWMSLLGAPPPGSSCCRRTAWSTRPQGCWGWPASRWGCSIRGPASTSP